MKTTFLHWNALVCVFFFGMRMSIFAQGPIIPTGTPGATMKSLDQIEARTPISAAPFTISSSGSYYLTKNLSVTTGHAITVNANSVTLDLNGFTISSTQSPAAGGYGIILGSALKNIAILNGSISSGVTASSTSYTGTGFGYGISYNGTAPTAVRVSGVLVSGCLVHGIYLGTNSTVAESCTVDTAGSNGITATSVSRCAALNCGSFGILANNVSDSFGTTNVGGGSGIGIYAATATNCYGSASGSGAGVNANNATNCWGDNFGGGSSGDGVHGSEINNCRGSSASSGGSAIFCDTVSNSFGANSGNGAGITATVATNCYGSTAGGGSNGGMSTWSATNCFGFSNGGSPGLTAKNATGCFGTSATGNGLNCTVGLGCYGFSDSKIGLTAETAIGCYGESNSGGAGMISHVATSCSGSRSGGIAISGTTVNGCITVSGTINFTNKYNMP